MSTAEQSFTCANPANTTTAARLPFYRSVYLDYRRYRATGESWFQTVVLNQAFWTILFYRIARAALLRASWRPLRKLVRGGISILQKPFEIISGIEVPAECNIGAGLYIGHHGTIIFPAHGRIGRNCNVGSGVTIGVAGKGERRGAPTIGDRVFIGVNSVVVGNITVGDDAVISAGSIVTRSVPARGVMVGNPARLVSYDGSFDLIDYDGMETDPARLAAMAERPAFRRGSPESSREA